MSRGISREYFVALSNNLLSGNLTFVLRHLHCPLVVFVRGQPHLFRSKKSLSAAITRYRNLLLQQGVEAADVCVTRTDLGVKSYIVSTTFLDRHGTQLGTARARYFLNGEQGQTEMIEYQTNPFFETCGFKRAA